MKEKLQTDLRFLKPWWVRLIISGTLGFIISAATVEHENGEKTLGLALVVFILLYLLTAWLYPSAGESK